MARDYADVLNGTFGDEQAPRAGRDLSVIFGSGIRLMDESDARTQRRLLVYPCAVDDAAQFNAAQGLMCALTWALNALDNVVVMPLLTTMLETVPSAAFTPDDFMLDGLGEDTLISAQLASEDGVFRLTITASSDIDETDDLKFDVVGNDFAALLSGLVDSNAKFAVWLNGYESDAVAFPPLKTDSAQIKQWLERAFALHLALLRDAVQEVSFNFEEGEESPFYAEFSALHALTSAIAEDAVTWLFVQGVSLASGWFEEIDPEGFTSHVRTLPKWQIAAPAVSRALIDMGDLGLALETLKAAVEEAPEIPLNWLVLARLYLAAQRPAQMFETIQGALDLHFNYAPLLMLYGETSLTYADQGLSHGHSIRAGGADEKSPMASEAVAAFEEVLRLTEGDQRSMASVQLITALTQVEGGKIWLLMQALAANDPTGLYTELAIGVVSAQDDIENAIEGLKKATDLYPQVGQVWRNLAYVQYLAGDYPGTAVSIAHAVQHANGVKALGDYELLALYAQDSKLEAQLADIADTANSGVEVSERNLELLEWIVGEAPHYAEGYLLLARAYTAEGEGDTALEVLLDAEENVGIEAEITVSIIDLLRESGEETVALDYVTKGLEAFPRHIRLLARAAQVTHALGDEDGARAFLRQAHNIAPYHRELLRVTREIMESEDGE